MTEDQLQRYFDILRDERASLEPPEGLPEQVLLAVEVGQLLEEETRAELDAVGPRFAGFAGEVLARLDALAEASLPLAAPAEAPRAVAALPAPLDARAVELLRAEVASELEALAPSFRGAFAHGVERRLQTRMSARPTVVERLQAWWHRVGGFGYGLGLAGAATASMLVFAVESARIDEARTEVVGFEEGQVSVDAVDFEGDVMMIPDDGATVVILSGV